MYEVSFATLSERFYKTSPWPPVELIADYVDNDHVFCILYKACSCPFPGPLPVPLCLAVVKGHLQGLLSEPSKNRHGMALHGVSCQSVQEVICFYTTLLSV